jgi:hypothetical protein|tara:strand:- start:210 stop:431 length:222 start_codon:yes stop_codon:yes gene_type:complete
VFEAEVDQPFQVDHRSSGGEGEFVAFDAGVAAASVAVGDEPCNDSFDHGSVLASTFRRVSKDHPPVPRTATNA